MEQLPAHVAAADEPIPAPGKWLPGDGPDLRAAQPVEHMLADLAHLADDEVAWVARWREHMATAGLSVLLHIDRGGERHLIIGSPCDTQVRHRSRWSHFLIRALDMSPERRPLLLRVLDREGMLLDERPTDPRATTVAVRDFLLSGGRLLITPDGMLEEGGGLPEAWVHGTREQAAEVMRAGRAYFGARKRLRADRQIKRAIRMLGKPTPNGWTVLEHDR